MSLDYYKGIGHTLNAPLWSDMTLTCVRHDNRSHRYDSDTLLVMEDTPFWVIDLCEQEYHHVVTCVMLVPSRITTTLVAINLGTTSKVY
jgi:hypothetical protein